MTFRTRLLAAFGVVVLVPLLVFGLGIRREMSRRVAAEYEGRLASLGAVIRADVERESARIAARLAALEDAIAADNRFRTAVVRGSDDQGYVLDYAGDAMRLAGLDFLQIQDAEGRIVSSGHFRNEYERLGPAITARGPVLVRAAAAEGPFLALLERDSMAIAGRRFRLLGGVAVDSVFLARLARSTELAVAVALPGDTITRAGVVEQVALPYLDAADGPGTLSQASVVVYRSGDLLGSLRRNVNTWFGAAVLIAALVALLLASWLSTRISEPLEAGLRDMERRIAIGELARQVNHDVKNGLGPLRNVFRHFAQVARAEPAKLPEVFAERQGTIESSIGYLETLAANYAKLSPQSERKPTDVNAVVRDVVKGGGGGGGRAARMELADSLPPVSADALVLRRVLENLLGNAIDSLEDRPGTVSVATSRGNGIVRIAVKDTGRGMTKEQLDKAFDDFFTTKAGGTGLGLSIVRRLVLDSNGALKVETEPGKGSTFIVELPALP
jgi:signal transduction histidine kinase